MINIRKNKPVIKLDYGSYMDVDLSNKSVSELNIIAFKIIKEREERAVENHSHSLYDDNYDQLPF